ncbi:MAG: hypothetical protein RL328_187 [Acidobacteriota bacterium]|jgi:hypothetical protein
MQFANSAERLSHLLALREKGLAWCEIDDLTGVRRGNSRGFVRWHVELPKRAKRDAKCIVTLLREAIDYEPNEGRFFWNSGLRKGEELVGTIDHGGYRRFTLGGRSISLHHAAWILTHGVVPANTIDHINRVRTDNRIANLREATSSEQLQNRASENSTGFRGVCKDKRRFAGQIKFKGKKVHLGVFATPEEAAAAYDAAAVRIYGPDALTNARLGLLRETQP